MADEQVTWESRLSDSYVLTKPIRYSVKSVISTGSGARGEGGRRVYFRNNNSIPR